LTSYSLNEERLLKIRDSPQDVGQSLPEMVKEEFFFFVSSQACKPIFPML